MIRPETASGLTNREINILESTERIDELLKLNNT